MEITVKVDEQGKPALPNPLFPSLHILLYIPIASFVYLSY